MKFLLFVIVLAIIAFGSYTYKWLVRNVIYAFFTGFPFPKNTIYVETNILIPMADGIKLAADIYRPRKAGKYPVILIRTSYNKTGKMHPYKQLAGLFASHGYVFIVQDVRGKYGSEGEFQPYLNEASDGHQTVSWANKMPWANGKIAIIGMSYLGSCAWLATRYHNSNVTTIIAMFTSHDTHSMWIDEGIPNLRGTFFWLARIFERHDNPHLNSKKLIATLYQLPVNKLDIMAINRQITFYHEYLEHIDNDSFWEKRSVDDRTINLNIPVFIVGGWYDPFLKGTIADFQGIQRLSSQYKIKESHLLIGPWAHNPAQKFKKLNFEKHASANILLTESLHWCEQWLKDKPSPKRQIDKVRYFIMGKNVWRTSPTWPPPNVSLEKYYLGHPEKEILQLNGGLTTEPFPNIHTNSFVYNPNDPTLFRGTYHLHNDWIAPTELDEILLRKDVLVYTTPKLTEDLTIAGSITFVLFVSSTALDTDFFAQICDVHPDGKAYNIALGLKRMRYRNSLAKPQLMDPGKIYRIEIPIQPIATTFFKGHRIQLHIASADFPTHERNLNTGLNCEESTEIKEAIQTIYTGGFYDSHLLLPILQE